MLYHVVDSQYTQDIRIDKVIGENKRNVSFLANPMFPFVLFLLMIFCILEYNETFYHELIKRYFYLIFSNIGSLFLWIVLLTTELFLFWFY